MRGSTSGIDVSANPCSSAALTTALEIGERNSQPNVDPWLRATRASTDPMIGKSTTITSSAASRAAVSILSPASDKSLIEAVVQPLCEADADTTSLKVRRTAPRLVCGTISCEISACKGRKCPSSGTRAQYWNCRSCLERPTTTSMHLQLCPRHSSQAKHVVTQGVLLINNAMGLTKTCVRSSGATFE